MVSNASDASQSQGLLTSSATHDVRGDDAPQSVQLWDAPQVYDPASKGLHPVDYDGRNAPQAVNDDGGHGPEVVHPSSLLPDFTAAHYGQANDTKPEPASPPQEIASLRQRGRRRLMWAIMIAAVVAIAIAVGVGAGVGISSQSNDSGENSAKDNSSEQ
jgi:hypothetical protein